MGGGGGGVFSLMDTGRGELRWVGSVWQGGSCVVESV